MLKRSLVVALLGAMLGVAAAAAPGAPLSPAATAALVRRMQFSGSASALAEVHLAAVERWAVTGRDTPQDVETDAVSFCRGVPVEVEQTHNQTPLPAGARARQQRMAQQLCRRVEAAERGSAAGEWLDLDGEIWALARFTAAFTWQADAVPGGWRLHFAPAPQLHPRSRVERILSRTAGALQLSGDAQVTGGEFHSLGAVSFGGGLLAHFSRFSGEFTLQPAAGGWVLQRVEVRVEGREFLRRVRGTETMVYTVVAPGGR